MKKLATLFLTLFAAFAVNAESKAITLNGHTFRFEDFSTFGLTGVEQGFVWNNFYHYNVPSTGDTKGYGAGLLSGSTELYSLPAYGTQSITRETVGEDFSFTEIWATASNNDEGTLELYLEGWIDGQIVAQDTIALNINGPTYKNFSGTNFENIDELKLVGLVNGQDYFSGGQDVFDYQYVIDAPVPEPTTLTLGALGFLGLIGRRRK